ncbi:MAG: glycosyltransferase family 4 protein [Gemmataceae bacterium]
MKLAALVEAEDHVCCRYRLAAFRPHFEAAGHSLDLHPVPKSWYGRLTIGRIEADAIIVQRKLLPRVPLALLRHRAKRLIFDFDDAVWLRDSYSPKGFHDRRRASRFRHTAAMCDLVVAGNETLAAEARTFANRVVVIPTCVDSTRLRVRDQHREHADVQLVWVGSSSTLRGLEQFIPTLSAIGREVPGTRLKIICDRFLDIFNLPVDRCVWNEATEGDEIAAADIGIGWVPDDPWSRGKCGLKVLQYQAAGLPVVANPVGVQADFVRIGVTGFQATTTEQWVNAIRELASSAELRRTLGAAGRRQVEERYSVAAGAKLWLDALQSLSRKAA